MEKNGKPTTKCSDEKHNWPEVSGIVYAQPDGTITRECTGIEGEYSRLYRECKKCGEPQVRSWRIMSRYNNKPNPPRIDQKGYIEKLRGK